MQHRPVVSEVALPAPKVVSPTFQIAQKQTDEETASVNVTFTVSQNNQMQ